MPLQDHIHLARTISAAPESSPVYKWSVLERVIITEKFGAINTTDTGRIFVHRLTENNQPVMLEHYEMVLLIMDEYGYTVEERRQQLQAMLFNVVYFVDHYHSNDNNNHTPYVKTMLMESLGDFTSLDPGIQLYEVSIFLRDASRMVTN